MPIVESSSSASFRGSSNDQLASIVGSSSIDQPVAQVQRTDLSVVLSDGIVEDDRPRNMESFIFESSKNANSVALTSEVSGISANMVSQIPPDGAHLSAEMMTTVSAPPCACDTVSNCTSIEIKSNSITIATSPSRIVASDDDDEDAQSNNHVSQDGEDCAEGAQDDDSDYEYEYEDDEDHHFSGFLMEDQSPFVQTASSNEACANSQAQNNVSTSAASMPIHAVADDSMETSSSSPPTHDHEPAVTTQRKSSWREPSAAAVSMSLRAEREKTGGRRRLAADLYKIMMQETTEQGFELSPTNEDSMEKWTIKLFGFDPDSNLQKDMAVLGVDRIELEMSFPEQYPFEPPFVRVVKPRFKRQTGFVMNGALCMELLTTEGWNPVNDIDSVIVSIRSLLVVGDGRLAAAVPLRQNEKSSSDTGDSKRRAFGAVAGAAANNADNLDGEIDNEWKDDDNDDEESSSDVLFAAADDGGKKRKIAKSNVEGSSSHSNANRKGKKSKSEKVSVGSYTASEAAAAYSHLSDYHKKKGWDTTGWWARKG